MSAVIIKAGFANFGRTYKRGQIQVRNNMLICYNAGPHTTWGFAEIEEAEAPNERRPMNNIFGQDYSFSGGETRVPILVPHSFGTILRRRPVIGCRGIDNWGPTRLITEAVIHLSDELGSVARMNTHFHRQDDDGHGRARRGPRSIQVTRAWDDHFAKLQARTEYYLERGIPVIGTADTNDHREHNFFKDLHPRTKMVFDAGIDKGWIILPEDSDLKVRVTNRRTLKLNIDRHNAHIGTIRIDKKA